MTHPFDRWPQRNRRRWFLGLLAVYLVVQVAIGAGNGALTTESAPDGIITFELAGTPEEASRIVSDWERAGAVDDAGFNLGFDFLYMPLYGAVLAGLVVAVAHRARGRGATGVHRLGVLVAWTPFLAVAFDVVETAALVRVLDDPSLGGWPALARVCALAKFALLLVAVVYVLAGWVLSLARASRTRADTEASTMDPAQSSGVQATP